MTDLNEKFLPPQDMPEFHRPFWDGLKQHRLLLQQCDNGHMRFIPTEICHHCGSEAWSWQNVSGKGSIYSYTVVHRGPTPAYQKDAPYVIAHVELEEGPRMIGNLIGCDPAMVRIGMPVRVTYDDVSPEWTLYKFVPANSPGDA
jgi:uncharacterized OB-fold protein